MYVENQKRFFRHLRRQDSLMWWLSGASLESSLIMQTTKDSLVVVGRTSVKLFLAFYPKSHGGVGASFMVQRTPLLISLPPLI